MSIHPQPSTTPFLEDAEDLEPDDYGFAYLDVVQPINWDVLSAEDAEAAWFELNEWVDRLRRTYGLPPAIVPPLWHRHPELVWELSALHLHWKASYEGGASPSAPLLWHRDFAEARNRLREWVAGSGTKLDRDRPTRQTAWPGEDRVDPGTEVVIVDRESDFGTFVADDVANRRAREHRSLMADLPTGTSTPRDETSPQAERWT